MSSDIVNIHDAFFKETFTHIEPARSFFEHYLPKEVASLLDLSTLTICKDSFIDSSMQTHYSDVLYEVKLNDLSHIPSPKGKGSTGKHQLILAYVLY